MDFLALSALFCCADEETPSPGTSFFPSQTQEGSIPAQQRALFSPGAGAACLVSCPCCSNCFQVTAVSISCLILCLNSFFPTQTLFLWLGKASPPCRLLGLPLLTLIFRQFLLTCSPSGAAAGKCSSGAEFHGKSLNSLISITACSLQGLKSWEWPL